MNRRTFLQAVAALAVAAVAPMLPKRRTLGLYDVHYSSTDEPYTYASYSEQEALAAYRADVGEDWGDEEVTVVAIDNDEFIEFLDTETGEMMRRMARELANECRPNCCVLCDAHYC